MSIHGFPCRVEGSKRYCTTEGGTIEETILKSDDDEKVFQYVFDKQDVFPADNIKGTMKLEFVNTTQTNLLWDVEFDIQDESIFPELKKSIEELYLSGASGLEKLANTVTQ